jgi:hypothetical protein
MRPNPPESHGAKPVRKHRLSYLGLWSIAVVLVTVSGYLVVRTTTNLVNSTKTDVDCGKDLPVVYEGSSSGFMFANITSIAPQSSNSHRSAVSAPECVLLQPGSQANATIILRNNDLAHGHVIVNVTVTLPFHSVRTTPVLPTMIGPGATTDIWLVTQIPSSPGYYKLVPTIWVD